MGALAEKKNDKRGKIARAALKTIARKGYASTSVEQISAEAGIGKSTVYEYYKTKEDLFIAAVMDAAEQWVAEMEAIGGRTRDPGERLRLVADVFTEKSDSERLAKTRLFMEVFYQTAVIGGVFYEKSYLVKRIHRKIVRIVVDYLLAGVSRGQLRPDIARNAEKIVINFLAFLDGISIHGLIGAEYIDVRDQIAFFIEQMAPLLCPPPDEPGLKSAFELTRV